MGYCLLSYSASLANEIIKEDRTRFTKPAASGPKNAISRSDQRLVSILPETRSAIMVFQTPSRCESSGRFSGSGVLNIGEPSHLSFSHVCYSGPLVHPSGNHSPIS